MLEIRFLKAGVRVGLREAITLREAKAIADGGLDGADQAVIVYVRPDRTTRHIGVRPIRTPSKFLE